MDTARICYQGSGEVCVRSGQSAAVEYLRNMPVFGAGGSIPLETSKALINEQAASEDNKNWVDGVRKSFQMAIVDSPNEQAASEDNKNWVDGVRKSFQMAIHASPEKLLFLKKIPKLDIQGLKESAARRQSTATTSADAKRVYGEINKLCGKIMLNRGFFARPSQNLIETYGQPSDNEAAEDAIALRNLLNHPALVPPLINRPPLLVLLQQA